MTIFSDFTPHRGRLPILHAQSFAFEQLVFIHSVTTDLRWAMVELAWRSLTAMCAVVQGKLVQWARKARTPRAEEGRGRHCCC
jgi:hypothetical protein